MIYAERVLVDYTSFADCGKPGIALVRGTTATFNTFVSSKDGQTTVTVNTNYSQVRQWQSNVWTVQCTSTGGLEQQILAAL